MKLTDKKDIFDFSVVILVSPATNCFTFQLISFVKILLLTAFHMCRPAFFLVILITI